MQGKSLLFQLLTDDFKQLFFFFLGQFLNVPDKHGFHFLI